MNQENVITIEQAKKLLNEEKSERAKKVSQMIDQLLKENNCELEIVLNIKTDGSLIPQYKVRAL